MKGVIITLPAKIIMALGALLIATVLVAIFVPTVLQPRLATYGNIQALTTAQTIAVAANDLSTMDQGEIVIKRFPTGGFWDLEIKKEDNLTFIIVTHELYSSDKVPILGNVSPLQPEYDARGVRLLKRPGKPVEVGKI